MTVKPEDLHEYVLELLPADEHARLTRAIERDAKLAAEVAVLRETLGLYGSSATTTTATMTAQTLTSCRTDLPRPIRPASKRRQSTVAAPATRRASARCPDTASAKAWPRASFAHRLRR